MRTARYTIHVDDKPWRDVRGERARKGQWSRFTATCRSLAKDGFEYAVAVTREGERITVTVTGTAGRAQTVRAPTRKVRVSMPALLTVERCRKLAVAAMDQIAGNADFHSRTVRFESRKWMAFDALLHQAVIEDKIEGVRDNLAAKWCDLADPEIGWHAGILRTILNRDLSAILWELSYAADTPYHSMACVNVDGGSYWRNRQNIETARKWFVDRGGVVARATKQAARDYAAQSGMVEAELEYWREMELLSGQRAHFKPGLTDETLYADDEVAA